ncbi:MAG: alpha/beta fold hydrolase [Alphaproteobacteria bacterium]|nr:alpha/beta fold hydrolase [Alphaproteobacteria bacterium]
MPRAQCNGVEIAYETHGPQDGEAVLMTMGLGWSLIRWPDALVRALTEQGLRVIVYDNRDIGHSEKLDHLGAPDFAAIMAARMAGETPRAPYFLADMADDAVALLDALHVSGAHLVGVSMGGMISQLIACDHRSRALSLTSIMSTTGNLELPPPTPEAMALFASRPPDPAVDFEGFVARGLQTARVLQSPAHPASDSAIRARVIADYERSYSPAGFARQYGAVLASPDRRPKLRQLSLPAVVLHGIDDPLVPVNGGRDTAANIPGAELRELPGMGHDLPDALMGAFADAILSAVERPRRVA